MTMINSLNLLLNARNKQAVVAAPAGQPQLMPPPGAAPPMDPAMMQGGMPPGMPPGMPMDPAMMGGMPPQGMPMDPAMMQGGMPPGMPMDPAMMGAAPPMDPAMMGGEMPPEEMPADPNAPPVMNIEQEITDIKEMLQALMESQIALMQTLSGGAPPAPPMDPAMMGGMPPMDPGMAMPPQGMPMDPAMMQGGMQVTASHKTAQDTELAAYLKSISDLLR